MQVTKRPRTSFLDDFLLPGMSDLFTVTVTMDLLRVPHSGPLPWSDGIHIANKYSTGCQDLWQCKRLRRWTQFVYCHKSLAPCYSVKPRLSADFYHQLIAHWLSTVFLRTFTHLYGKFLDVCIRSNSKLVLLSLPRRQLSLKYFLLCKYKGEESIEQLRADPSGLYMAY